MKKFMKASFILFALVIGFGSSYCTAQNIRVNLKTYLQGVYSSSLGRHKDVTSGWASILNSNALNQPYSGSPWNYSGTESVASNYFASTGNTTDIVDWVLLELRDGTDPSNVLDRKAAFIREDGLIVDLDGTSLPGFTNAGVTEGYFFIGIRHRNHLGIISSTTIYLDTASSPSLYNFTGSQSYAYFDTAIAANDPMADLPSSIYGMRAGNANANDNIRYTGLNNDAGTILAALGGNQNAVLSSVYNICDLNLDGSVKYTGLNNDAGVLLNALGSDQNAVLREQTPFGVTCLESADAGPNKTICSGSSTTIGTAAVSGYTYSWAPTTGLNNANIAQPIASPTSNTIYFLEMKGANLLTNPSFESGNTGFSSDYTYATSGSQTYNIVSSIASPECSMTIYGHNGTGSFLKGVLPHVNANTTRLWYQTITVTPNTRYVFSGFSSMEPLNPYLIIRFVGNSTGTSASVPDATTVCGQWEPFETVWNSATNTSVRIEICAVNPEGYLFFLDDLFFGLCTEPSTDAVSVNVISSNGTVTPAGPIAYYYWYENTETLTLTSTQAGQWYKNGTAISGATGNTYNVTFTGLVTTGDYYKQYGCSGYSNEVYVSTVGCNNYSQYPVTVPAGYHCSGDFPISLEQPNIGSGANYYWSKEGPYASNFTFTPNGRFATLDESGCTAGCYADIKTRAVASNGTETRMAYTVGVNVGCLMSGGGNGENNVPAVASKSFVAPNPARSEVTVTSVKSLERIEIYAMNGMMVKSVKGNNLKVLKVDLSRVANGVYSCKLISADGVESLKLVIQR